MTVRLLVDWKDYSNGRLYKVGNLLTTDSYTESGLISSGLASSNLVGGTSYVDPVPAESYDEAITGGQKGNLVVATTNPLTGVVEISSGSNVLKKVFAGVETVSETILLGSNSAIEFTPGSVITAGGTYQHTMIRTGNAEFSSAAAPIPGVSIYCADEQQTKGAGTLRYTHATTSLAWMATGETSFGAEVDISGVTNASTVAVFAIQGSTAGKAVYVYVAPATRSGVIERSVIVDAVTGAKAITWTRSSNLRTVSETAHGRRIGDFVINFGPNGDVSHGYIASVTADTYTFSDTGSDQGSAQVGRAYGVRNISIYGNGAVLDYNKSGLNTALMSNLHAMIFNACSDVTIENLQVNNATKYACLITGFKNVAVDGFSTYRNTSSDLSGNSDVVHPLGPGRGFVANRIRAQGGDNIIGVGCADYYDYVFNCPAYGDLSLIGGRVADVWAEDSDEHPVRFYNANGANIIKNWVVDGVFGTYSSGADACTSIITDTMSGGMVDSGQTNIDGLTIVSPDAVRSNGTASFAFVNRGAGTRKNIQLRRVRPRPSTSTIRATCWVEGGSSIADMSVSFEAGDFSGYLVGLTGASTVGRLVVSSTGLLNGNNELGATFRPVVVALDSNTSTITRLDVQGLEIDDSSSTGTKVAVVLNNGTIGEVLLSDIRILDGDAVYRHTTTAAAGQVLRARNINANADHVILYDGGGPAHVDLYAVWHNKVANALLAVNESTARDMRIRLVNCRAGNRMLRNITGNHTWRISGYGNEPGAGGSIVTDAGTPSWRLDGDYDLVIDGALLDATVTNHRAGASFYNTNAAFSAGVGKYARGSATWTRTAS